MPGLAPSKFFNASTQRFIAASFALADQNTPVKVKFSNE
jgi:hypothetical protein